MFIAALFVRAEKSKTVKYHTYGSADEWPRPFLLNINVKEKQKVAEEYVK